MTESSHAPQFDSGPLSWVMSEIREALERSRESLLDAAARAPAAQSTPLQHARAHLHQAHGALQMVDVDGVGMLTQAAEEALGRFRDGSLPCTDDSAQAVAGLYQAVVEYLEELLSGASPQPVRLFPYYRDVLALLGAERVHPADLLVLDLSAAVMLPERGQPAATPDYAACRARFEKALLPFLKTADGPQRLGHARELADAVATVEAAQHSQHARTFWLAMHSFAELVAGAHVAGDIYAKQLFGLINLQLRRLSQGQQGLPETMLRDALFFIAAAPEPSALALPLRRAWRLDGMVPCDYDARRYGRIDPLALKAAREALAQAKSLWDRIGTGIEPTLETAFGNALAVLEDAGTRVGVPALARLPRELSRAAKDSIASGRSDQLVLEMAAALLFAEHALDQVRQLPAGFEAQAQVLGARLLALAAGETPPAAPQWQGDLSRQIRQDQTVAVLAAEMKAGLRQVEKVLDEYYADASKRPALAQIDPVLHQLNGALAILDQEAAMRAASHVRDAVRRLAAGQDAPEVEAGALSNIAQNIGALGFFIDVLARSGDAAREQFVFDTAHAMFRTAPAADKGPASATPFEQPEAVPEAAIDEPLAEVVAPAGESEEAIEAELLEIFISEAQEVLEFASAALPGAAADRANQETLTLLRRSFHTLKGSGRMVGLDSFADAAAALERVMNVWLADAREASDDLLALLGHAVGEMGAWVAELAADGVSGRSGDALVQAAALVQDGGSFDAPVAAPAPTQAVEEAEEAEEAQEAEEAEEAEDPAPAHGAANVIEFPGMPRPHAAAPEENVRRIGTLSIPLPLYNIYLAETDELMRTLRRDFGEWRHEPERPVSIEALKASHTLAGTSATVGFTALRDLAHALEMALEAFDAPGISIGAVQHALLDETLDCAGRMLQRFALSELAPADSALVARLDAMRGEMAAQDVAHTNVDAYAHDDPGALFADGFDAPDLVQAAPPAEAIVEPEREPELAADAQPEPVTAAESQPVPQAEAQEADGAIRLADDLDPDLLPVFLEEAADLLPEIGHNLRQWQQNRHDSAPAQAVLRALHTVKGSARMAGAMRLGQHTHDIETQVENMVHAGTSSAAAFDELMANYDQALLLYEQLQQPAAQELAPAPEGAPSEDAADEPGIQSRTPLVRVRADILDRLVNQAGEVSITRSKLEDQVGSLKLSLADFAENLARLRRQLREVEMQAETQIASRMSIAGEREFDPLEFDRFTRLQELTRMMAESVNDVASFHEGLTRTVDSAGGDLAAQSRLTRELQRDLMRVRMVPFSSLAERLYRVARQAAKEMDKRVNLDIRGGSVEIDRSVLEQMAAPFEHLLRNAIVHGIEARERRAASGKAETGELLVQVSQQGNEVVIRFGDDGAGLDLERIRARARENGLLAGDATISDDEAAALIFEPGFSTADVLTELAGRGVGMDVVRAESQALGGRVAVASEPGKGAQFTIHLPLTLAVTQVVLTSCGGRTHALPSVLVEQVLQLKEGPLAEARAAGAVRFQGKPVTLRYLPQLLGDAGAWPTVQRSTPVLILRSGNERLAVQVDEVQGNREVVVKNIGPQLARMAGIAGATVLGSGEIVLILNPVDMTQQPGAHAAAPVRAAVMEAAARAPVVMVVDDSLTMRKVAQRMLEREGYQVVLAKDGVNALELLPETRPDLMLVDIEMPRMDGFDLTRNIRGNEETRAIPVIMITSRSADKHRNYAFGLGVNAYFGKPFQEDALLEAVAGLLQPEPVRSSGNF